MRVDRLRGVHLLWGRGVELEIAHGRIVALSPTEGAPEELLIAPGLVDLQVNGYGGIDLNSPDLTPDDLHALAGQLAAWGVTSFLPTVITNSDDALEQLLAVIARARAAPGPFAGALIGVHLEGPFISPEEGPRGAHDPRWVRPPDWEAFTRWQRAAEGAIRLHTLSPEWPGSQEFIARCAADGVTVAIGHTSASPEQIQRAVAAGARLSTHLGNGAHPMLPRHPNYIWEQLACDELWASFIADGLHLPAAFIKVLLRAKGRRAVLVSDLAPLAGLPPGRYTSSVGGDVLLTPDGRLQLASNPSLLAGATHTQLQAINHLVAAGLCARADAWRRASTLPAELLGLWPLGTLRPGAPADLVVLREGSEGLRVLATIKGGELVHSDPQIIACNR